MSSEERAVVAGADDLGISGVSSAELVGRGGFAVVYRALQEPFGRPVAVKVLTVPLTDDDVRRRFHRECRIIGQLTDQPGIVTVFQAGTLSDGRPYLVMPFIDGGTLGQRLTASAIPVGEVVVFGRDLAEALAAAHSVGVVHCDVKPANVLIGAGGRPQLVDFGISAFTAASDETLTAALGGTPAYLPPEALDGAAPAPSRDVYSLGATLYACLSGKPPFHITTPTGSLMSLMRRIAEEEPADLGNLGVPSDVAQLIASAMAKDPARRPSAQALALRFADLVAQFGRPIESPLDDEVTVLRAATAVQVSRSSRRRWVIGALLVAAVVIPGALVAITRADGNRALTSAQRNPPSGVETTTAKTGRSQAGDPSTASTSSTLVPVVPNPAPDDGRPALDASLSSPMGMAVAPDGSMIVADTGHHRIRRIDPDGIITTIAGTGVPGLAGDGNLAVSAQLNEPRGVVVASDGAVYVADTLNHRIRRINPDGVITTIAGSGLGPGFGGDGGQAPLAMLNFPTDLTMTADGALLITETYRIRKVRVDGVISTLAGIGEPTSSGDGGPATAAGVVTPWGIFAAPDGSVVFVDSEAGFVRRVGADGIMTTVAGNGQCCSSGDGGPAAAASIWQPHDITLARDGAILVTESGTNTVRRIGPEGLISTLAGIGRIGAAGDGGLASIAELNSPRAIVVGPDGRVYIADTGNHRIRVIGGDGTITTVAGTGTP